MAWWSRKKIQTETRDLSLEDLLLSSNVDASVITKEQAMSIPALNAGVNLISSTFASLPIKLYRKDGDKIKSLDDDPRVRMLNATTGDQLDGFQMKKALCDDYITYGAGYMYPNKKRNEVISLHYVSNPQVGVALLNPDPIFKSYEFIIYGKTYKDYELVKLTRKTKDGVTGLGIVEEANKLLSVAWNTLQFEQMLVSTGGQRKGFLKSSGRLSPDAITQLKTAFKNLYSNNSESVVILNNGLEFQESNNNSVEMQINQNKVTNDEAIARMLNIPVELLGGKVTQFELLYNGFIKLAIMPIVRAFESALNKDLLLEEEKGSFYFAADTSEIEKFAGNILQRFQAYQIGIQEGFYKLDEVREFEGLEPIGFDFVKLGLADVLLNPDTNEIYTPNTNKFVKMGEQPTEQPANVPAVESPTAQIPPGKGGDTIENGNSGQ